MSQNKISYKERMKNTRLTDFEPLKDIVIEHHRHLTMDKKSVLDVRRYNKNDKSRETNKEI